MKHTSTRKRILFVENGIGYGGAIICLRHLVRNLDPEKYEAMVVTGLGGPLYADIASEAHWRHIADRRFDTVNMKKALDKTTWLDYLPGMRWLVNQAIARLDDLVNFLPYFLRFLWTAWSFKPDIIHVNNEPLCNRGSILAGKLLGIPIVAHVRGDQQGSRSMQWFFQMPSHFIPVSRWVSESIGCLGVPADKRTYIYDGIDLESLDINADGQAFRSRYGIPAAAFTVGLVGLLIPWKGQKLFLDSARRLVSQVPEMVFVIVGGTPEECASFERELRELAEAPELEGRVVFTGHVKDMPAAYNGLDVVVSASTLPEPLGTMVIESLTMARPLIAPNHGGALEMIEDGVSGLIFKANDVSSLSDSILHLYNDPELRKTLGNAARSHAISAFSIKEHVIGVTAVYHKLISNIM